MTQHDPRAARVRGLRTTVFSEFSALSIQHRAVNLGQGVPDFEAPEALREVAVRAIRDGRNQYALGEGTLELREAVADHAERFYDMAVDPGAMVTITAGATEAIFDTILALCDPGDEVILFEPFYDAYLAAIALAGGVPRFVRLHPPDEGHPIWWFDEEELSLAFGSKTKLILVNTPHNPTGKVFTRAELEAVAALCQRHDVVAVSDEVYEHIVFPPARHERLATLDGMGERTVTVSSGGKSFNLTGWKVGWLIAAPPIRRAVQLVHQFVTFSVPIPLQEGVAAALRLPDDYFGSLARGYLRGRDHLVAALRAAGLASHAPEGAYFVLSDVGSWGFEGDDAFCRFLIREVGVAAIPASSFYRDSPGPEGQRFARFAFCKPKAVIEAASNRLRAHGASLSARGERSYAMPSNEHM
jgi:N-succinyldiaminopimelate aminotransferase